jgi:cysteine desulfurase family protein (TIGR01976 family)
MALDLDFVRRQFPALAGGFVYFDNAGGSAVLKRVADRVHEYLTTTSVQTGASYVHSQRAGSRLAEARSSFAHLVGAGRPEEIIIGPSATVLCQNLARALKCRLQPGDEIIVTDFDHESNIGPWRWLEQFGINIRVWGIDRERMEIDLEALDALMTRRTRLVAVTHTSNILGTINPIAAIAERVHAHGAEIAVDAVAFAPHRLIDVVALDVDYYIFSFYKVYGPHLAMMYGKYDKLLELDGLYHYFYGKAQVPQKLEPGNPNYELAWGAAGIVEYFDELGGGTGDRASLTRAFDDIAVHEEMIGERLLSYLRDRNDVRVFGRRDSAGHSRVPTISFKVDGRDSADIAKAVDEAGIGIRFGDFHSKRLVETLGASAQSGVLRVSMVHYNTIEEVDRLIDRLEQVL